MTDADSAQPYHVPGHGGDRYHLMRAFGYGYPLLDLFPYTQKSIGPSVAKSGSFMIVTTHMLETQSDRSHEATGTDVPIEKHQMQRLVRIRRTREYEDE